MKISAALFDLDGTLADTAPDLVDALNRLLEEQGKTPLPFDRIRRHASFGAKGLIECAFGESATAVKQRLTARFLTLYAERVCEKTRLFPSVMQTLEALGQRGVCWGVVTNKARSLAEPILKKLGVHALAHCCVYGDTTANKKPHPAPILLAIRRLEVPAHRCVYVGDSERDVLAAKAANVPVLLTAYGYESSNAADGLWGCDGVLKTFADLLKQIEDHSQPMATAAVSAGDRAN